MTTIIADYKLGLMVSDSNLTDGDRSWTARKVHRIRGALVGLAGIVTEGEFFLDWYRAGASAPPEFDFSNSVALVMDRTGLYLFDINTIQLMRVHSGREAIGTGSKGAICAFEALNYTDPARAVRIACKHDSGSRPPVRTYRLFPTTKASR